MGNMPLTAQHILFHVNHRLASHAGFFMFHTPWDYGFWGVLWRVPWLGIAGELGCRKAGVLRWALKSNVQNVLIGINSTIFNPIYI
jgi:hypothetical protein